VSDAELVRRVLEGEVELFRILVERYRREFGRYAAAMLGGDADEAADALQEAFIRAYDALGTCREPAKFKAWVFRIVTNQCHNARRRRRPHLSLDRVPNPAGERADTELSRKDVTAAIEAALEELTAEQRTAFVMKHIEGRSYAEMAEMLNVGEDALKMRVHRARNQLKQRLEGVV
jgi:RNA polymerase sigma-70 factor (ECF subfamily)